MMHGLVIDLYGSGATKRRLGRGGPDEERGALSRTCARGGDIFFVFKRRGTWPSSTAEGWGAEVEPTGL